jgi:hypothetical protein
MTGIYDRLICSCAGGNADGGLTGETVKAAFAAATSPIGLFNIFSNVNRFRAEIGRVWRMNTVSSRRSSESRSGQINLKKDRGSPLFSSCVNILVLRSSRWRPKKKI